MKYLQLFFDVVILLFWIRIWSEDSLEFYFNPYLARASLMMDRVMEFFLPVLRLSEMTISILVIGFVMACKVLVGARFGAGWDITVGSLFHFTYPVVADGPLAPHIVFAGLSLGFFLVRLWTVYFLVRLITPYLRQRTRAMELFDFAARPLSWAPLYFQCIMLIMMHWILVCLVTRFGQLSVVSISNLQLQAVPLASSPFHVGTQAMLLMRMACLTLLSFADGLSCLTGALVFFIVVNLIAALVGSRLYLVGSHELVNTLLGRFARLTPQGGSMGIDFRPLFFFLVVNFIYGYLTFFLYKVIM